MKLYETNKAVLSIKNNPAEFLNGLTSNTMDAPNNAFLTIHGKIVATFDQIKVSGDEYLILIERPFVDSILKHLDRYIKLGGVKVEIPDWNVYFDLENDAPLNEGDWIISQKKGRLLITKGELEANVSDEEFTLFRLKNSIPMHGVDYQDEMLLNVSEEDFVSFTKGCFLGQEPISKVHNRSQPTWKLVVKYEDQCYEEERSKMTSKTVDLTSGRVLGFIFVRNKDQ
jgi:folate-binding protein YgfZ